MNDNDLRAYRALKKYKIVSLVNSALIFKDSGFKGIHNKLKEKKNKNIEISQNIEFSPYSINIVFYNKDLYDKYFKVLPNNFKYNTFIIGNSNDDISVQTLNYYFNERSFIYIVDKKKDISNFTKCFMVLVDDNFEQNVNKILSGISLIQLLANYENKNSVTAKCSTFFNYEGTNYYSGGAERYLVDLHSVCKNLNLNFDIYQNANKPFIRKFREVTVIGMHNKNVPLNYSESFFKTQMEKYINMTSGKSQLHIFSAFHECYPLKCSPSIGISHGISWDNKANKAVDGIDFWNNKKMFINSALNCDKMISVDTNTANWFQTIDYELGNQKVNVITNYVDTKEFCPDDSFKKKDKIVITYPRRLYEPRGMYLLLDIVDDLFSKYDNIEIHFVGKGFDEDVNKIKEKMKIYPDKLFCYSMEPEKMHEVYKKSDISLVPTLYSEGTSLSCLEAMSTGNIVVCTRIGGLTDLVINGLNGYLIEPNKKSLLETLENIIENIDKQDKIKKNAIDTAKALNKNLWKDKWTKVIKEFDLKETSNNLGLVEFYVKDANNLSQKILDLIKTELLNNNLIYIRSKKTLNKDNVSFGLVQLVDLDEKVVSEATNIYVERGIKVNRAEKIIYV